MNDIDNSQRVFNLALEFLTFAQIIAIRPRSTCWCDGDEGKKWFAPPRSAEEAEDRREKKKKHENENAKMWNENESEHAAVTQRTVTLFRSSLLRIHTHHRADLLPHLFDTLQKTEIPNCIINFWFSLLSHKAAHDLIIIINLQRMKWNEMRSEKQHENTHIHTTIREHSMKMRDQKEKEGKIGIFPNAEWIEKRASLHSYISVVRMCSKNKIITNNNERSWTKSNKK